MNNFLRRNITVKIISILFAVILWAYAISEQNPEIVREIRNVSVAFKNLDVVREAGLVLFDDTDFRTNVWVSGRRRDVMALRPENIRVEADMAGDRYKGFNSIPVHVSNLPEGIRQVDISPKSIRVYLDDIIQVQVPVVLETTGTQRDGYILGTPIVRPSEIILTGPSTIIGEIVSAVVNLDIEGINSTVNTTLPIILYDKNNKQVFQNIAMSPSNTVEVTQPVLPTKRVEVSPQIVGSPAEGFYIERIEVEPGTLVIAGSADVLRNIDQLITESVDVSGIIRDSTFNAGIILPDNVTLITDISTATVRIVVIEEELEEEFQVSRLNVVNLEEDKDIDFDLSLINIVLKGKQSIIRAINEEDIVCYIDVQGLESGEYEISIQMQTVENVEIVDMQPGAIQVVITDKE